MSGACTCCPGEIYMGQRKIVGRRNAACGPSRCGISRRFEASSGCFPYLAVATFCLHRSREAVRVLMDCRLTSNLVVFARFANSALMRGIKGTADSSFLFGVETLQPAPASVGPRVRRRKPAAKHEERPAKRLRMALTPRAWARAARRVL